MGFLDRLFGRDDRSQQHQQPAPSRGYAPYDGQPAPQPSYPQPTPRDGYGTGSGSVFGNASAAPQYGQPQQGGRSDDEIALERYRYLLRTAPPERIEQAHEEAFAQLTPEQRRMVYQQMADGSGGEAPRGDDPHSLAQAATRAEFRKPGTMEGVLGRIPSGQGGRGGPGFGSMLGASLLGTVGGYVIGSAIMSAFLPPMMGFGDDMADGGDAGDAGSGDTGDAGGAEAAGADGGADAGGDFGGDAGAGDGGFFGGDGGGLFGGGDGGGLFGGGGDFGGDFGGGFDF